MAVAPRVRTARERVRVEMTTEILAVARDHLAREGAAGLSLRSVARQLGIAPSALYRYFDGRDALLSALILAAYESLAEVAEGAAEGAAGGTRADAARAAGDAVRWPRVPRALRGWALEHPHEWGLVFGTPVPGYQAPPETVEPYRRVAMALLRPVVEAQAQGRLELGGAGAGRHRRERPERPEQPEQPESDALRASVAPLAQALFPESQFPESELPVELAVRAVEAWGTLIGLISLEVFGHWRNTLVDPGVVFEAAMADLTDSFGLV